MRKAPLLATLLLLMGLVMQPGMVQAESSTTALPTEMDVLQAVTATGIEVSPETLATYARTVQARNTGAVGEYVRCGIAWQLAGYRAEAYRQFAAAVANMPDSPNLYARLASTAESGITVYAQGQPVTFPDAQPQIVEGRTLVPFRAIAEALGAEVAWDGDTKTATVRMGEREVRLTQDSNLALIGLNPRILDVPATVVPPGRFAVPLRFLGEALGFKVQWIEINPGAAIIGIYRELKGAND